MPAAKVKLVSLNSRYPVSSSGSKYGGQTFVTISKGVHNHIRTMFYGESYTHYNQCLNISHSFLLVAKNSLLLGISRHQRGPQVIILFLHW